METNKNIKCSICGQFIGYSSFSNKELDIEFTPDTAFTIEKTEYTHKKCNKLTERKKQ